MIEPKGYTGAAIQAAIDAAKPVSPQAPPRVVTLPPGEYLVTEPIRIEHAVRLEFDGAWLKASGEAAIVIEGNAASLSVLRYPWIYGTDLKRGIVCHSSLVTIESPMVSGAEVGILLESGMGKLLEMPIDSDDWFGCDHVRLRDIAIWDCVTGIRAHGSDTNNAVLHGVYGQTVTNLVDDNTLAGMTVIALYHENGRKADLSDDPIAVHARSAAGTTLSLGCGSDGPRMLVETNAIVVGEGFRVDGQCMKMTGNGLNRLQVTTDAGQAGLLDGAMGCWTRRTGDAQLFGHYDSDVIGDGNWPAGWHCIGSGPSRRPGIALPGERVTGRRGAMFPEGIQLGDAPMQSTAMVTMGTSPPSGPAVEGDWCINSTPRTGIDYWRCVVGGDAPTWEARGPHVPP